LNIYRFKSLEILTDWNNEEEFIRYPIERQLGYGAFYFPRKGGEGKILRYKVEVVNCEGEIVEKWEHHFWTELIDIDRRSISV
jgi:hypothetical protein